jgi:hypothetical protein
MPRRILEEKGTRRALTVKARSQKEGINIENPTKFNNKTFVYLLSFKMTRHHNGVLLYGPLSR